MEQDKPQARILGRRNFVMGMGAASLAAGTAGAVLSGTGQASRTDGVAETAGSAPAMLDLPRIAWEGGPEYWRRFAKAAAAGWTDPAFFPVGVFFGRPAHAKHLKSLGINVFQAVEHNDPLSVATAEGMFCIPQDEFTAAEIGEDPLAVGLLAYDECDMGLGCGGATTQESLANMRAQVGRLRSRNDGRFINANYSKGVLETFWARGTMGDFMSVVDAASVDNYAYTSPHTGVAVVASAHWPSGVPVARSATYGWLVDRMRAFQASPGVQPNWMLVETAMPYLNEPDASTILPEQIEGACWSAIIHEARGIVFFQHNNDGINGNYSLVDSPLHRQELIRTAISRIRGMAPVLNTQSYKWDFGAGSDTMLKAHDGAAYVFASIALGTEPGSRTFTLPASFAATAVEVVGEARSIPISNSTFTDVFPFEYNHHIYRIPVALG
jgi:hypothetical protein